MVTLATEQITIAANKRLCKCDCGELIDKVDKYEHERFYRHGHGSKGHIPWNKDKKGLHANARNDNVTYSGLHQWVNKHRPKPIDGMCENCHKLPYRDLACITGQYTRDFNDWQYLCRGCHIRHDRPELLIPEDRKCCGCGSSNTCIGSDGVAKWSVVDRSKGLYHCSNCDNHERRQKRRHKAELKLITCVH